MDKSAPPGESAKQVAALPWRLNADGQAEVLLVTSRISRHWLLPKGWPMARKSDARAAAREALEEAGIEGKIAKTPIGTFDYLKLAEDGAATPCAVAVFPMIAVRELDDWREREQRERRWFTLDAAAAAVYEPGLAALLAQLQLDKGRLVLRSQAPPGNKG